MQFLQATDEAVRHDRSAVTDDVQFVRSFVKNAELPYREDMDRGATNVERASLRFNKQQTNTWQKCIRKGPRQNGVSALT